MENDNMLAITFGVYDGMQGPSVYDSYGLVHEP